MNPGGKPEPATWNAERAVEEFRRLRGVDPFGPFLDLLVSPELMNRVSALGEYLRYRSALPPRLSEFAILVTADVSSSQVGDLALVVLVTVAVTIAAFWRLGLYRAVVRFLQSRAIFALALGATASIVPLALTMIRPGLDVVSWKTLSVSGNDRYTS